MSQIHKRFSSEQIKLILTLHDQGSITKRECLERLEVKERQFYALLARYRAHPKKFTIEYKRRYPTNRIPRAVEQAIHRELEAEKRLIDHPQMPVKFYNYAAIRDAVVKETGQGVTAQTVINRAKSWGFYIEKPKRRAHTREVLTEAAGMLLQHDASEHLWSPFADRKWSLITTLDDHSRKLLYGGLFETESAWTHIQAAESVILKYGVGLAYYSDNHSIFRYIAHRDSTHINQVKGTDDVTTQWKQCLEATGMQAWYAMSPEAKGKIERPYRWLQDRIVRRCAKAGIADIAGARYILADELDRYNNHQVHSTTGEIPSKRFANAVADGRTVFHPLRLKPPITSTKDIFCLRTHRTVDGYGRVSYKGHSLEAPKAVPVGAKVELHIIPEQPAPEIRLWYQNKLLRAYRVQA
jgi:hypothetical protein